MGFVKIVLLYNLPTSKISFFATTMSGVDERRDE